jgi:hypothetical protein
MRNVQPSRRSGIPAAWGSYSFFVQSGIVALYPPCPSLCLNLFFWINSFILLLLIMASGVVCSSLKVFYSFGVMNPNRLNDETPEWTYNLLSACMNLRRALPMVRMVAFSHIFHVQKERHNVPWSIPIKLLSHLLELRPNQSRWSYISPSQEHHIHCAILH